jgi:glycosyltransferase involved in cell wall biosynthesis
VFAEGGTERWAADLVESTPPFIRWRRICVLDPKVAYGNLDPLKERGVQVVHGFAAARKMAEDLDVIVGWGTVCTRFWSRESKARLVVVAHGDGASSFTRSIMQANKAAHLHVCCSRASLPCIPSGVQHRVICNAVNTRRLAPTVPQGSFRTHLRVAPGKKLLGFVGRLSWEKNPYAAVATIAAMPTEWALVVVGDGDELPWVKRYAVQRGVAGRVHFVGVRRDVGNVMQDLDALIVPSTQEGFGYVIAEGWASGIPVFSTRVGAAALWPDCVHEIPNRVPPGQQRGDGGIQRLVRRQPPFQVAANTILKVVGSPLAQKKIENGLSVTEHALSLRRFGTDWAAALASTVGHIASKEHLK